MGETKRAARAPLAIAVACVVIATGCISTGPHVKKGSPYLAETELPSGPSVTTFYALGDWGTGGEQQTRVASALDLSIRSLDADKEIPPFVLGLGDNVYENGLKSGWENPRTLSLLNTTFGEPYSDLRWQGQPIQFHIVPGNHDYAAGMSTRARKAGYGDVIQQETAAEGMFGGFHYYPLNYPGKPDSNDEAEYDAIREAASRVDSPGLLPEWMTRPEVVGIPDQVPVTVLAIDTQSLIERPKNPGERVNNPTWHALDSLLAASNEPWKIVVGHHPIATYGSHGNYRTLDNWLWTGSGGRVAGKAQGPRITLLTTGIFIGALIHPVGWIAAGLGLAAPALSVIGDNIVKHRQDTDHWAYQEFADSLESVLVKHGALYLSGHDHSLQLIELSSGTVQVISGSSGKASWVASSAPDLQYSAAKPGFARFDVTEEAMWMQFCTVDRKQPAAVCGPAFGFTRSPGVVSSIR